MYLYVNKRFIERSQKKRGITFEGKLAKLTIPESRKNEDPEDDRGEYYINSQESNTNPVFIKYGVTVEDLREFRKEAHQVYMEVKSGDHEMILSCITHLIDIVTETFKDPSITFEQESSIFGILLRARLFFGAAGDDIKIHEIDSYIPALIKMCDQLMGYPKHLEQLLSLLINISINDKIGGDFIYEEYNFIPIMQDIFRNYPYNEENVEIHECGYLLLGNLASDGQKARDLFVKASFLQHLTYLLTDSSLKLHPSTINTLAYVIERFTAPKIQTQYELQDYEGLIKPLEGLLYINDDETVDYALSAMQKMLAHAPQNGQLFADLSTDSIGKQILDIADRPQPNLPLGNALKVIGNLISGDERIITFLIDNSLGDILIDGKMSGHDSYYPKILLIMRSLSLSTPENIAKMKEQGLFAILIHFLRHNQTTLQVNALKVLANIFTQAEYKILEELMDEGYIKEIVDGCLNKYGHIETNYWGLSAIYLFLSRDIDDPSRKKYKAFAIYFQEIRGVEIIYNFQTETTPNNIYEKTVEIITQFYEGDEEDEPERVFQSIRSMRDTESLMI